MVTAVTDESACVILFLSLPLEHFAPHRHRLRQRQGSEPPHDGAHAVVALRLIRSCHAPREHASAAG